MSEGIVSEGVAVSWVFDVISPFAYLGFRDLARLPDQVQLRFVPVLLAGMLSHFGQRGPAEIPGKRRFTYRFVLWRARRLGIPISFPPAHPFNPLAALRLVIAAGSDRRAAGVVLNAAFRDGRDLADPAVKQRLRENTEWAISLGVFGVPTLVIGRELFWGHDAFEMGLEYLRDRSAFEDPQMAAVDSLPVGVERPR